MTFTELTKRLDWIKNQPQRYRDWYLSRINDKGFWSLKLTH